MKPFGNLLLTVTATVTLTVALAACDGSTNPSPVTDDQTLDAAPADADTTELGTAAAATPSTTTPTPAAAPRERLAKDAPVFASLYPEATLNQPVVLANGADGPGGIAEFTTAATPDEVIAHYRRLADDAGLKPVMAMNQGNARAFAALNPAGAEVQVVASLDEAGTTSVQLTWKNGQ